MKWSLLWNRRPTWNPCDICVAGVYIFILLHAHVYQFRMPVLNAVTTASATTLMTMTMMMMVGATVLTTKTSCQYVQIQRMAMAYKYRKHMGQMSEKNPFYPSKESSAISLVIVFWLNPFGNRKTEKQR